MKAHAAAAAAAIWALLPLSMVSTSHAGDNVDLIGYMGNMQYMAQKTSLAIHARNQPLAGFYVHEIEEIIEELEKIDSFDGYPIGSLAKTLLVPSFEALEASVKAGDWDKADKTMDQLLISCNSCHETTEHGYIHIQRASMNPFMQSFEAR